MLREAKSFALSHLASGGTDTEQRTSAFALPSFTAYSLHTGLKGHSIASKMPVSYKSNCSETEVMFNTMRGVTYTKPTSNNEVPVR